MKSLINFSEVLATDIVQIDERPRAQILSRNVNKSSSTQALTVLVASIILVKMGSIVKYSLLTFPVASFGLGVWQLKRLEWKKALLANLEAQIDGEPIDLLSIKSVSELKDKEYRRVKTRGRFDRDPNHQLMLSPRQLVMNDEALRRGKTEIQSNIGVNIVTPFRVEGTDLRILVNRGWLAKKGTKDSLLTGLNLGLGPEDEPIELVSVIRKTDDRPRYGLKNNESSNDWQIRDVEAMARILHTAPIFVDADQTLSKGEGPIGGQTQLNVRNEHLNYAITWFLLSALCLVMWRARYRKQRR